MMRVVLVWCLAGCGSETGFRALPEEPTRPDLCAPGWDCYVGEDPTLVPEYLADGTGPIGWRGIRQLDWADEVLVDWAACCSPGGVECEEPDVWTVREGSWYEDGYGPVLSVRCYTPEQVARFGYREPVEP